MTFDLTQWKQRAAENLRGWKDRLAPLSMNSAYVAVSAGVLWPLVLAARGGDAFGAASALMALRAGLGTNLLAHRIQRWTDEANGEADIALQLAEAMRQDAALRAEMDAVLEKLDALALARAALPLADREWFAQTLRAELSRLGNLQRFEARIAGDHNVIIQGQDNVFVGPGGTFIMQPSSPAEWRQPPPPPFMADSPPPDFVQRPHEFDSLISNLLPQSDSPVAIATALRGAGGYGKTTLAKAVCADARVRLAFPDGILWVPLGERLGKLELIDKMMNWIEALTGERPGFTELEAAQMALAEALGDRHCLLVIDDVWNESHLRPFLHGGPNCVRLITTRDVEALPLGTRAVKVDAMQSGEAVALLSTRLGQIEKALFTPLAERLGEWPLLLQLVNRVLRYRVVDQDPPQPVSDALAYVTAALQDNGLTAFDKENPAERSQAVAATLGVSLQVLNTDGRARYVELAVFPEDVDIPLVTLEKYWGQTGGLSAVAVEQLCDRLDRLSLLWRFDLEKRCIRLHDVMLQYLVGAQREQMSDLHQMLLDGYRPVSSTENIIADWAAGPNDGYFFQYLTYHLHRAGRQEELRQLMLNFKWLQAKLEATDAYSLLADYERAMERVQPAISLIQSAVRLSAHTIAQDNNQLAGQLLGRLLPAESESIVPLLEDARSWRGAPWLRPLRGSLARPGGSLKYTLVGHADHIRQLVVTPDGHRIVSGSADSTVRVWDIHTGKPIYTLTGHPDEIEALAVTQDGRRIISVSKNELWLWEIENGHGTQMHRRWRSFKPVALTPDGHRAFSVDSYREVSIWSIDAELAVCDAIIKDRPDNVGHPSNMGPADVSITPDGHYGLVVISSRDKSWLEVWNLDTGQIIHTLNTDWDSIELLRTTPDSERAIASIYSLLKVWDIKTGELVHSIEDKGQWLTSLAITSDSHLGFSTAYYGEIAVWDLRQGKVVRSHEWVNASLAAVSPDGKYGLTVGSDDRINVWDVDTLRLVQEFTGHTNTITALTVTPDGSHVVSASDDGTIKVWKMDPEQTTVISPGYADEVDLVAITPDGQRGISAAGRTLKVWDMNTGESIRSLIDGERNSIEGLAVTPDNQNAIYATSEAVRLLSLSNSNKSPQTLLKTRDVWSITVTPDSRRAVFVTDKASVSAWDINKGEVISSSVGQGYNVWSTATTPDGRLMVAASYKPTEFKVWDIENSTLIRTFTTEETSEVYMLALTPDGRRVISAAKSEGLKIWDTEQGDFLFAFEPDVAGDVHVMKITPEGRYVLSGSDEGKIIKWDLDTGRPVFFLTGHTARITSIAVTSDGLYALSVSLDGSLRVWNINGGEPVATFICDQSLRCGTIADNGAIIAGDRSGQVHLLRLEMPVRQ